MRLDKAGLPTLQTKALARAAMLPDRIAQLEVSIAGQVAGQLLRGSGYEFRYLDPRPSSTWSADHFEDMLGRVARISLEIQSVPPARRH